MALAFSVLGGNARAQQTSYVNFARHAESSTPLRDMPSVYEAIPVPRLALEPGKLPPLRGSQGLDSAMASAAVEQSMPLASSAVLSFALNFEGEGIAIGGLGGDPSDTNGAVGATQYVEWINTGIAIFNKTTGALTAGPVAGNSLFSALGGDCASLNDGDPIALYDKFAHRWILAQFAIRNGSTTHPYHECVAVSTTMDATGSYHLYDFTYSNFNDYPKIGVWNDKYLITFNMFAASTNSINNGGSPGGFLGGEMCAFDRANMLKGNAATQACVSDAHGGILPSDLDGLNAPKAGELGYFMAINSSTSLALWSVSSVNFGTDTLTLSSPKSLTVTSFSEACGGGTCIPQAMNAQLVDSLADRLMYRLAYRVLTGVSRLVVNHSVATSSSTSGIRWYEIRNPGAATPTVTQQSTFAPDTTSFRWMGSAAMDHNGDIAIGYSRSDANSLMPSIYVAVRSPADPLNTLGAENALETGTGATGDHRWGDYTAMTVDPLNDCMFWFIDQYLITSGAFNWNTRINSFQVKGCGTKGSIMSPVPGSTLSGATQIFTWANGVNVAQYTLWIGTTGPGSSDIGKFNGGVGKMLTVNTLPTNGSVINVRLRSLVGGVLQFNDYTYTTGP